MKTSIKNVLAVMVALLLGLGSALFVASPATADPLLADPAQRVLHDAGDSQGNDAPGPPPIICQHLTTECADR